MAYDDTPAPDEPPRQQEKHHFSLAEKAGAAVIVAAAAIWTAVDLTPLHLSEQRGAGVVGAVIFIVMVKFLATLVAVIVYALPLYLLYRLLFRLVMHVRKAHSANRGHGRPRGDQPYGQQSGPPAP